MERWEKYHKYHLLEMYIYLDSTGELETIDQTVLIFTMYIILFLSILRYIGQDTFVINSQPKLISNISES